MKNLTYNQLIELAPKDRPFQIEVRGSTHWAFINNNQILRTLYTNRIMLGPFTLIDPRYQKPEVLKVGQKVRIMESARGLIESMNKKIEYRHNASDRTTIFNRTGYITRVEDTCLGVYYYLDSVCFPHYCVMPVEE